MRRDSKDERWQETKKKVRERDRSKDRILKVLTVKEALLLQRKAPNIQLQQLDVAHIFPVGMYPEMMYDPNNCVLLNRYSHQNLDNMKHPITGEPLSYDERQAWWQRIANGQWAKIMNVMDHVTA